MILDESQLAGAEIRPSCHREGLRAQLNVDGRLLLLCRLCSKPITLIQVDPNAARALVQLAASYDPDAAKP